MIIYSSECRWGKTYPSEDIKLCDFHLTLINVQKSTAVYKINQKWLNLRLTQIREKYIELDTRYKFDSV